MLLPTPPPRLKRFRRADPAQGETLPPLDLQPRDRDILRIIFELRLATSDTIGQLLEPVPLTARQHTALDRAREGYRRWLQVEVDAGRRTIRAVPTGKREIRERLRRLYHHGFVNRHKISNNHPIVYHLAPRAVPELTSFFGIDHDRALHQTREDKAGLYFVEHTLMIGRFRAALTQALRGTDVLLAFWEPDGAWRDRVMTLDVAGALRQTPLIPDGYFGIAQGTELHHCFLEIDRGTMTPTRIYEKLQGYREFFLQGLHQNYHIDHFRVLTVSPGESRTHILRAATATIPTHRGLFWFCSEPRYLDTPGQLLAPIWQTAKNDDWRALLEPRHPPRRLPDTDSLFSFPLPEARGL